MNSLNNVKETVQIGNSISGIAGFFVKFFAEWPVDKDQDQILEEHGIKEQEKEKTEHGIVYIDISQISSFHPLNDKESKTVITMYNGHSFRILLKHKQVLKILQNYLGIDYASNLV